MSTVDELRTLDYSKPENLRRLHETVAVALGYTDLSYEWTGDEERKYLCGYHSTHQCRLLAPDIEDLDVADYLLEQTPGSAWKVWFFRHEDGKLVYSVSEDVLSTQRMNAIYETDKAFKVNIYNHPHKCAVRCLVYLEWKAQQ